ncbi:hypothetical protein BGW39_006358 [Mortierella sp. 14UC]|nr:hypothetical protein BGW39_006358 [Mortierella sp. 14UC]
MTTEYKKSRLGRMRTAFATSFEEGALRGPARIGWAICTFGYTYPRRRVGENVTVCIFRTFVIFITRFACILGTIWYLRNLAQYLMLGDARPYNILSIETETANGTIAPVLNIFSSGGVQAVQLTSMSYHDFSGDYKLDLQITDHPDLLVLGSGLHILSADFSAYTQYVLKHNSSFVSDWTRVGLIHPNSSTLVTDARDLANQYFFYPGHMIEIRYAPLEFHSVNRQTTISTSLDRFKYFLGFGGETTGFSYKSSVSHMPFPPTRPATWDNLTTVLIIRPETIIGSVIYNEEKTSIRATMSDIGGLIGIVGSILVFLFGVSLMSPWGFISDIPYFRRRITGSLAEAYTSQGGLSKGPFTTHQLNIGRFEPGMSTEMRVAMVKEQLDELELVLMEYYIDGAVFQDYDKERTKVKIRRAASMRSRVNGVDGSVGAGEVAGGVEGGFGNGGYGRGGDIKMEALTLPSRTLFESQHQHRGQLPSPEHPPVHPRRVSLDRHHRRTSSSAEAGGVFDYYQQQKLQQHQQQNNHFRNSTLSEQGLLHSLTEEDPTSPTRTGRGRRSSQLNDRTHFAMDMYDQDDQQTQHMGLLQQDHLSMHQSYLQNTSTAGTGVSTPGNPAYPPRPPKDEIMSMHLRNDSDHTITGGNSSGDNGFYYSHNAAVPIHSIATATAAVTSTTSTSSPPPPVYPTSFSTEQYQDSVAPSLPASSWWKRGGETTTPPPQSSVSAAGASVGSRPVSVMPLNPARNGGVYVSPPSSQQQQQQVFGGGGGGGGGVDLSNLPREF